MESLAKILEYLSQYGSLAQFFLLLGSGYLVGSFIERRHYRFILHREQEGQHLPAILSVKNMDEQKKVVESWLVVGMVSISTDFYKRVIASIINLFGGNIRSYESLVDRARREALLRMRAQARGAHMVVNVRVENSNLFVSSNKGLSVGSVEIMAYGTAVRLEQPHEPA